MEYFAGKEHCTSCMIHLIPTWLAALNEKLQNYIQYLLIVIRLFISYKFPCQSTVSPHVKIGFSGRTLYSILLLLSVTSYHLRPSSDGQKNRTTNSLRLPELPSHKSTTQSPSPRWTFQIHYSARTNSPSSLLSIPRLVLELHIPSRAKPRPKMLHSAISPYKSIYPHREERFRRSPPYSTSCGTTAA